MSGFALSATAIVIVASSVGAAPLEARAPSATKSDNVRLVEHFEYTGGAEHSAEGDYVYAGEIDGETTRGQDPNKGGMHVFDVSGRTPKEVGFLHCPGNDNDVEVVRRGLVVMGFHENLCALGTSGFLLIDVRNPQKPRIVSNFALPSGGLAHTVTPYPGADYVYVSPGGLPTNGGAITHIVDISNPRRPQLANTFQPHRGGCHDLSFHVTEEQQLAFCAGVETQVWDVSDPESPVVVSHIVNPAIQFHHSAVASSDGELLAIDDEAFAAHECRSGQSVHGRMWVYDISDPQVPVPLGSYAPPRSGDSIIGNYVDWTPSWCLAHYFEWKPGTHILATSWYTGGMNVLDFSTPSAPREVAYYQSDPAGSYSTLWHRGLLWVSDNRQGMLVLDVEV